MPKKAGHFQRGRTTEQTLSNRVRERVSELDSRVRNYEDVTGRTVMDAVV